MIAAAMTPSPGAANGVVPKNGIGIAFWIDGVPGSADIVNVDVPSRIAPGMRRPGMFAARKSACPIGPSTKNATNKLTPPYVTSAPASTTARIARCGPSFCVIQLAIAVTEPESSMSLPKTAPSRNKGKNCITKPAAAPMKVMVQLASSGSLAASAARSAAMGARTSTLHPRKENQTRNERPTRMPPSPITLMDSHPLELGVDVEGRADAQVFPVRVEERGG